ncbi:BZ3500_MvSof-1268-A1-R1_Chr1-1g00901 [Microbotryum saponariae]|uniref:BZ3500_MvSof-1268-A1-R1_Chr1-1g00901 protein n=1 Tax=Microbotryum saponariae TaxID=289078 RepID=A0A2X0MB43_9BASI|nr:BZ3500_MvSof-1268-A1-R1_Chr1-1g00901 [Microbotryum saponariae]SCZ92895.1 BZ3501_MvSof-1269-A2-R1_Chr1-1g00498 [Microbotryum saponariae]
MSGTTKKPSPLSWTNLAVGASVSLFEVTTFGQPLEVLKTHMAANRSDNLRQAIAKTYARGGFKGFYQGLIPWAWIESGTTGAILLFTATGVESVATNAGVSKGAAGMLGGIAGGAAQAYLAMGVCTTMKTAEVTRAKAVVIPSAIPGQPAAVLPAASTFGLFMQMYREGGIKGINKGVNAVAIRQMTNWGSRMGFARAAETLIRDARGLPKGKALTTQDKVLASAIGQSRHGRAMRFKCPDPSLTGAGMNSLTGGVLGCWNHPIEVVRVEEALLLKMQSLKKTTSAAARPTTMVSTFKTIYQEAGISGFFRGVTPRIGLGVWRTVCLVSLGDFVKEMIAKR